jgi:hypothetical protein
MQSNQGCQYKEVNKCKSCDIVYYNSCALHRSAHRKFLLQDILPVQLKSTDELATFKPVDVFFSRDETLAKTQAAKTALQKKTRIKKLTLSQCFTLLMEGGDWPEARVIYIEAKNKCSVDQQKAQGMLESFIDRLLMEERCIIVCSKITNIQPNSDWTLK